MHMAFLVGLGLPTLRYRDLCLHITLFRPVYHDVSPNHPLYNILTYN